MATPRGKTLTSIAKKIIMAVTGLALVVFLILHLAGNLLLLFPGPDNRFLWFNTYSNTLNAIPVLLIAELGLLAIFLLHAYEGLQVTLQNRNARPEAYQGGQAWSKAKSAKSRKSAASTFMMWSGVVILLFVALHVWHFKYHGSIGPRGEVSALKQGETAPAVGVTGPGIDAANSPGAVEELATHVVYEFKKPYVLIIYLFCMVVLGMHLYHAFWSSFQTLGTTNSKLRNGSVIVGKVITVAIAGGFFLLPLWVFIFVKPVPPMSARTASPAPIAVREVPQ